MNDTINATFLGRLRNSTAQAHQDLESLPISSLIVNPEVTTPEYATYLGLMQSIVTDVEDNIFPILGNIVPDIESRRKADAITTDLEFLGHNNITQERPVTGTLGDITPAFALGIMYVVEGSSLGGRVILKNITATLGYDTERGAAYFAGYGGQTGSQWKKFLEVMAAYESQTGAGDEIIEGANFTFNAIKSHFTQSA